MIIFNNLKFETYYTYLHVLFNVILFTKNKQPIVARTNCAMVRFHSLEKYEIKEFK